MPPRREQLLRAADDERWNAKVASHEQRRCAFGPPSCGAVTEQVGTDRGNVDGEMPGHARVDMREHATFTCRGDDVGHGCLDRPNLSWFASLHGFEHGVGSDRRGDRVGTWKAAHASTCTSVISTGARRTNEDGRVLHRRRDDMSCVRPSCSRPFATAPHTAVFTASVPVAVKTTSEGAHRNSARDLLARLLDRHPGDLAVAVNPARVSGVAPRLEGAWRQARRPQRRRGR